MQLPFLANETSTSVSAFFHAPHGDSMGPALRRQNIILSQCKLSQAVSPSYIVL